VKIHTMHVPGADLKRDMNINRLRRDVEVCVHEDPDRNGAVWNWMTMIQCMIDTDTESWSYAVQDDLLAYPATWTEIPRAVEHSPSRMLGLVVVGSSQRRFFERGFPYTRGHFCVFGPAVAYHRDLLEPMLAFAREILDEEPGFPHDDMLACAYMKHIDEAPAIVTRSLFFPMPLKSVVGHAPARPPSHGLDTVGPDWSLGTWAPTRRSPGTVGIPKRFKEAS
jgi:hypothetical protein